MANIRESKTIINYDKLYEHPEMPFKVKFVRTLEESQQTPEVKSLCFPSKLLEIYKCFETVTEETPLLHEWLQRNGYDFPEVVKFCDALWKSTYACDISDPRRRVLVTIYTAVILQIDDAFEKYSRLNERFAIDAFVKIVSIFSTLKFEPLVTENFGGRIDEKTIVEMNFSLRILYQIVLDAVDCFSPVAYKMFLDGCTTTFQGYIDCEYPIQARVSEEKRYVTLEEWVEVRRLSGGFNSILPFMYDEKQVLNIDLNRYNKYNSTIAQVSQYGLLFNDILSLPKEMKDVERTNLVQKFMSDQNLNLNEGVDEAIRFLDKMTNALEFLYDLTPGDQKDIFLIYWRYAASGMDYMLKSPRYGWEIVNATM